MNRLQYLGSLIALCIIFKVVGTAIDPGAFLWLMLAWAACIVPLSLYRFINMGKSPWWSLTAAIPVLAIIPVIMCLTWPPKAKEDNEDTDEE